MTRDHGALQGGGDAAAGAPVAGPAALDADVTLRLAGGDALVGERPAATSMLPTPCLVCDVDLLAANISLMQRWANDHGVALRPHVKSHKSSFIAALQLKAGAVGLACAKLAEAEAMVGALAGRHSEALSILITSPIVGVGPATRAAALARRCELAVVVDHPDGVSELCSAASAAGTALDVVCDVDVGLGRTGVRSPDEAVALAELVGTRGPLTFAGVQGYAGHVQHVAGRALRREAVAAAGTRLAAAVAALESAGFPSPLRSGAGTGTSVLDAELGVLTELQPGSYVFMDRQYRDALAGDEEGSFAQSLTIATTVVSANHGGFVTVDAGLKAMATDAGPPTVVGRDDLSYAFFGDEHGAVAGQREPRLSRADRLALVPPHCDPTVNLYDHMWLVRGQSVVGSVPVDARGASS